MYHLRVQQFSKKVTWMYMLHQFMKEENHSNAKFVTTAMPKRLTWIHMLYWFMEKKSQSNVTFVTAAVLKRITWIDMLHLCMKERSDSNVTFVTSYSQKRNLNTHVVSIHVRKKPIRCDFCCFRKITLKIHVESVHEGKTRSNVTFATTGVLQKVIWNQIMHGFMNEKSHSNTTSVTTPVLKNPS